MRVSVNGDEVRASGPENDDWVVYFIVETPRNATLDVSSTRHAHRAGEEWSALGEGLQWDDHRVDGQRSDLDRRRQRQREARDGDLAASTQNGPVSLKLPRGYRSGVVVESLGHGPASCRAERCTETRGREDDDDRLRRIELGSGPAAVHLSTVNGPVSVKDLD